MSLRTFFSFSVVALSLGAFGCSSSSGDGMPNITVGDPATCHFIEDKNNCWNQALAAVDACLSATTQPIGTMSADGKTCRSGDGRVDVLFDPPEPSFDKMPAAFDATILSGTGQTCAHFVRTADGGFVLTDSAGKTTSMQYVAAHQVKFTCPDGTGWQDNDQDACLLVLPGSTSGSYGTDGLDLQIMGQQQTLFRCKFGM